MKSFDSECVVYLKQIVKILEYQSKPSISNQGQCLDGYSALANYNSIAKKIDEFLKTYNSFSSF